MGFIQRGFDDDDDDDAFRMMVYVSAASVLVSGRGIILHRLD